MLNGFVIESNHPKVAETIDRMNKKYHEDLTAYARAEALIKRVDKAHDSLDKLIEEGNYGSLINISKDITYNPETIQKAKSSISLSVNTAIVKHIEFVSSHKWEVLKTIDNLMQIASDNKLKLFNCDQLMKQAGIIAIELCTKDEDSLNFLIKISNNQSVDNILNLKAAIRLGEVVLIDPEKYEYNIKAAVKELNTRRLNILMDSVRDKFELKEIETFDRFFELIKKSRSK